MTAATPLVKQPRKLSAFLRSLKLESGGQRQRLKRFIPVMVGTATTKTDDEVRAWLATDWLVRTFTPIWLDKAGLTEHAAKLRALPELTSTALARAALPIIEDARKASSAARAAAGAAAGDAAWAAAGAAAGAAARAAASKKKSYNAKYQAAYAAARPLIDRAFAETVKELTASAEELLERMCAVGR